MKTDSYPGDRQLNRRKNRMRKEGYFAITLAEARFRTNSPDTQNSCLRAGDRRGNARQHEMPELWWLRRQGVDAQSLRAGMSETAVSW